MKLSRNKIPKLLNSCSQTKKIYSINEKKIPHYNSTFRKKRINNLRQKSLKKKVKGGTPTATAASTRQKAPIKPDEVKPAQSAAKQTNSTVEQSKKDAAEKIQKLVRGKQKKQKEEKEETAAEKIQKFVKGKQKKQKKEKQETAAKKIQELVKGKQKKLKEEKEEAAAKIIQKLVKGKQKKQKEEKTKQPTSEEIIPANSLQDESEDGISQIFSQLNKKVDMLKELSPDDIKSILKQDITNNENIIEILTAIQNSGNATDNQNNELQKLLSISDEKKIILQKLANQHSNISENSNDNTNDNTNKKNKYLIELFFDNAGMHVGAINGEIGLNNFNQLFGQIIDPFQRKQENPPQQPEAVPTSSESEPEPQPEAVPTPAATLSAASAATLPAASAATLPTPAATQAAPASTEQSEAGPASSESEPEATPVATAVAATTPAATAASTAVAATTPAATAVAATTPAASTLPAATPEVTPAATLPTQTTPAAPAAAATPATPAATPAAPKTTKKQIYKLAEKGITTTNSDNNATQLVQNKKQIQQIANTLGIQVSNAKVDTTPKQVPIWQIMVGNYNPEFLQKYPDYLFLYGENLLNTGGDGPGEITQAIIRTSPNSFGINTCKAPGDCWKPGELKQATVQFLEDINKLLQVFFDPSSSNKNLSKKVPYRSIIIPVQKIGNQYKIALGRGVADLPKNAPEVYNMLEILIEQLKRHLNNKLQPSKNNSQENVNLKNPFTYTNNDIQIEGAKWVTGSPTLKPLQGTTD